MERYRWAIVVVLATVIAAGIWTAAARGDDEAPLTTEEKAELAARRREVWHNRQMIALWSCVAAVAFVSLLFWLLTQYNKSQKQQTEFQRKDAIPADIPIPSYLAQPADPPPLDLAQSAPLPLEPPSGNW
jgi:hypothetical protein